MLAKWADYDFTNLVIELCHTYRYTLGSLAVVTYCHNIRILYDLVEQKLVHKRIREYKDYPNILNTKNCTIIELLTFYLTKILRE